MNNTTTVSERNISKIIAKSGSISFLMNVAGIGIALLTQVVLARELGAASYGYYSYVMTVITFLVFPAKLGFDTSIVRYLASYQAKGAWGEVKGLLRRANQLSLSVSLFIMLAGSTIIYWWFPKMQNELYFTFIAGMLVIPFMSLTTLRQSTLLALKEVTYAQLPEKVMRPLLSIALLYAYNYAFPVHAGAGEAMLFFAASMLVSYLFGAWVLYRKLVPFTKSVKAQYHTKQWTSVSVSLMINAGMYLILGQLSVVMIGIIHGTYESGIFSAAIRIATMVSFAITSINMIAAPLISEQYSKQDLKKLQHICTLSARSGFAFAIVIFAVLLFGSEQILGLFGQEFKAGSLALIVLSISHLAHAFCGQCGTVMNMTGQQKTSTKILIVSTIMNIVLNLILIPSLGMVGAAVANLISAICCYASMVAVVKNRLQIQTSVLVRRSTGEEEASLEQ